jgi:hypothetical protein
MKRHLIALFTLLGLAATAAYAMPDLTEEQLRAAGAAETKFEQQREHPHQYAL